MRYTYDSRTVFARSVPRTLVPPRDHSPTYKKAHPPASASQAAVQPSALQQQFSKVTPIYQSVPSHHTSKPVRLMPKNSEFTKQVGRPKRQHSIHHVAQSVDKNTLEFVEANLDSIDLDITDGALDVHVTELVHDINNETDVLRHYFEPEDSQSQQSYETAVPANKRLRHIKRFLILGLVASVVGIWGYVLSDTSLVTQQANAAPQQTATASSAALETSSIVADDPAYVPKMLTIAKLGIHATIESIGVTSSGAMDVPSSIWNAGWYIGSAQPGQPGAVFIDGHATSTRGAIFGNLDTLVTGDQIEIERNDGKIIKYSVAKTTVVNREDVDMSEALKPYDDQKNGLTIMSCVGQWIAAENTMENRVLVYAVQL